MSLEIGVGKYNVHIAGTSEHAISPEQYRPPWRRFNPLDHPLLVSTSRYQETNFDLYSPLMTLLAEAKRVRTLDYIICKHISPPLFLGKFCGTVWSLLIHEYMCTHVHHRAPHTKNTHTTPTVTSHTRSALLSPLPTCATPDDRWHGTPPAASVSTFILPFQRLFIKSYTSNGRNLPRSDPFDPFLPEPYSTNLWYIAVYSIKDHQIKSSMGTMERKGFFLIIGKKF